MYTQCPSCLTVFLLDVPTLVQAHGHVTCGGCGASFDSLATLAERCPPEPFLELPLNEQGLTPPVVAQAVYLPPLPELPAVDDVLESEVEPEPASPTETGIDTDTGIDTETGSEPESVPAPAPEHESATTPDAPAIVEQTVAAEPAGTADVTEPLPASDAPAMSADVNAEPRATEANGEDFSQLVFAPRFSRKERKALARKSETRGERPRRWPWVVLCLALLLALALQVGWADRDALIASPETGPWRHRTCPALGCRLPLVRDTTRLQLSARTVRAHPSIAGALLVSATVHNDAPFAQPYPVVTLTLSDATGHRVAMRRLAPRDYLGEDQPPGAGFAAGADLTVVIEVADPGGRATGFDFSFE